MHKIFKATFHLKRDKEEQPRFITIEQNSKTRWFEFWFAAPLDSEQELITGTHRNFNECFEEALITLDACFPAYPGMIVSPDQLKASERADQDVFRTCRYISDSDDYKGARQWAYANLFSGDPDLPKWQKEAAEMEDLE